MTTTEDSVRVLDAQARQAEWRESTARWRSADADARQRQADGRAQLLQRWDDAHHMITDMTARAREAREARRAADQYAEGQ